MTITSTVLIVARTQMGQQRICVGAYDLDRRANIRLLTASGENQTSAFPGHVGDAYVARYSKKAITPPHTEDVCLQQYEAVTNPSEVRRNFVQLVNVIDGPLNACFSGMLVSPAGSAMGIGRSAIPDHSVCLWRCDRPLELGSFRKYQYRSGNLFAQIKYVGIPDPIPRIAARTVLRLSLSRWWRAEEAFDEYCWLQLSGWY